MKRLEKIVSLKMKILLAVAFAAAVFVCGGCKRPVRMRSFWKQWLKAVTDGSHKQQVDQGPDYF